MLDLQNYNKLIKLLKDSPKSESFEYKDIVKLSDPAEFTYPTILHVLYNFKIDTSKFERISYTEVCLDTREPLGIELFLNYKKLSYLLVNTMNATSKKDFNNLNISDYVAKRLKLYLIDRATYRKYFSNFSRYTFFISFFFNSASLRALIQFLRIELMYELDSFLRFEITVFNQLKPSAYEYYHDNESKFVILNYVESIYYTDLYKFYNLVSDFCSFTMPSLLKFNKLFFRIKSNVWYLDLEPSFAIFKKISINAVIFMFFFSLLLLKRKRWHKKYFNISRVIASFDKNTSDLYIKFFELIAYMICKKYFFINYKSRRQLIAPWPKFYRMDSFLFDIAHFETYNYVNKNNCLLDYKQNVYQSSDSYFNWKTLTFKKIPINFLFKKLKNRTFTIKKAANTFKLLFVHKVENNIMHFSKKKVNINFIRKQKCFNKGRYSRNRQLYRTGVYWCFYLNIAALLGLNFLFYKFTITFTYYWWAFFLSILFFIAPSFFRLKLSNIFVVKSLLKYVFNLFVYFLPFNRSAVVMKLFIYFDVCKIKFLEYLNNFCKNFFKKE